MKMKNKNLFIGGGIAIISAAISSVATYFIYNKWCYEDMYKHAAELYNEGKLKEALTEFTTLDGYKESDKYVKFCKETILRHQIEDMIEEGDLEPASWMFDKICEEDTFSNRTKDILRIKLLKAYEEYDNGEE